VLDSYSERQHPEKMKAERRGPSMALIELFYLTIIIRCGWFSGYFLSQRWGIRGWFTGVPVGVVVPILLLPDADEIPSCA
jgi:hypothetical protein